MSKKKKVVILYGGRSVEHGVSINSARNIFEYIDKSLFEPVTIGISMSGQWFLTTGVTKDIEQGKALGLLLDPANPGFQLLSSGERFKADLIFPVLHGTDGEDGSIQGMIKGNGYSHGRNRRAGILDSDEQDRSEATCFAKQDYR